MKWSKLGGTWLLPQEFLTLLFYVRTLRLHLPSHWHPLRCLTWHQSSGNVKGQKKYKLLHTVLLIWVHLGGRGALLNLTTFIFTIIAFLRVNSLSLSVSSTTIFLYPSQQTLPTENCGPQVAKMLYNSFTPFSFLSLTKVRNRWHTESGTHFIHVYILMSLVYLFFLSLGFILFRGLLSFRFHSC